MITNKFSSIKLFFRCFEEFFFFVTKISSRFGVAAPPSPPFPQANSEIFPHVLVALVLKIQRMPKLYLSYKSFIRCRLNNYEYLIELIINDYKQ